MHAGAQLRGATTSTSVSCRGYVSYLVSRALASTRTCDSTSGRVRPGSGPVGLGPPPEPGRPRLPKAGPNQGLEPMFCRCGASHSRSVEVTRMSLLKRKPSARPGKWRPLVQHGPRGIPTRPATTWGDWDRTSCAIVRVQACALMGDLQTLLLAPEEVASSRAAAKVARAGRQSHRAWRRAARGNPPRSAGVESDPAAPLRHADLRRGKQEVEGRGWTVLASGRDPARRLWLNTRGALA